MVDGMSSFGVKAPLCRAVVTNDFFYSNAEELVLFLKSIRVNENNYYFKHLNTESFLSEQEEREELIIKGCRKTRMISFLPSGQHQIKRHICNCDSCIYYGEFGNCKVDKNGRFHTLEFGEEIDALDEDDENEDCSHSENMFTFAEVGCFVRLYSAPNSLENFLICKVLSKGNADADSVDFYGHIVKSGDKYITGVYLEKINQKK